MASKQKFDEFIVNYLDNAHKLAEFYLKSPEDVEDVVAESVEKALRNIHALKDPDLMKGWFNKIIINTAINHLKKQPKTFSINEAVPVFHFDDFSRLNIEDLLVLLPEEDRKIIHLRFSENYALKEIADELSMNENTVKTRLYRALKKLRLEIFEDGYRVNVKKENTAVKAVSALTLAILLSATLLFNLSPALAAAAYDIPIIGDIVRAITFNRFEYQDGGYTAEILVPEIQGLLDQELQDRLNAEFAGNADDLIRSFEASILEIKELGVEEFEVIDPDYENPVIERAKMSVKADYEVKTDNERLLSLDAYFYSDVGNYELHKFYTIDKQEGVLVTLSSLFEPDADYITPISDYLTAEMERINREENGAFMLADVPDQYGYFFKIRPDNDFYVSDDGELVICFDKYEVAAGYIGSPEFVIPFEIINDVAASDLIGR